MELNRPSMVVRMFGPLQVEVAGRTFGPRDLGGVKPKQLLEVLLLECGRTVPKDRIADRLWGEQLPQRTGATIESYVSVLRRLLDVEPGLGRRVIVTDHGGYRMAAGEVSRDVDRFEALIRRAAGADLAARRLALEQAVQLADDELLADEPYADWVQPPREHCRALLLQALVDLAECCLAQDDPRAAISASQRALTLQPTSERAVRVQMLANCALGASDEAIRAYERCRAALSEELGVEPTDETLELRTAITTGTGVAPDAGDGDGDEQLPRPVGRSHVALPIGYAAKGGVRIAYQVVGAGPVDLVFSPSLITNLGATWDDPTYAAFLRRLASVSRLILFDKRGTGLSDPALDFPTQRQRSDDLLRVLDAADSQRAVLFGVCAGGALCVQFAADHPDRASGLVLHNSAARTLCSDDYPWGLQADLYEQFLASFEQIWLDESDRIALRNPGLADNPRYRDWFARYVRLAASPFMARRLAEMNASIDVTALLPTILCPTLIITRTDDTWMSPENSRYLARHIPDAQLVELAGCDHDPWVGDTEQVLAAVEAFISDLVHGEPYRVVQDV
jgi:pimeloyl-ACP methyl ester carboxylesterase/DNA-binding SARP family transcriptional activator